MLTISRIIIMSKPKCLFLVRSFVPNRTQQVRCLSSLRSARNSSWINSSYSSTGFCGSKLELDGQAQARQLRGQSRLLKQIIRTFGTQFARPYVDPKLSYAFGRSNEHLVYSTIAGELDKKIELMPDEVGFVSHYENKEATFRQLDHDVNKVAKALVKEFNIRKGDCVSIFAHNCYNWIVVQFACTRVGAVLVPINPSYKSGELEFLLQSAGSKCLFLPGPKSVQSELNSHLQVLQSESIINLSKSGKLALRNVVFMDQDLEYQISDCPARTANAGSNLLIENKLANCRIHNWSKTQTDGLVFKSAQEAEDAGVDEADACILNRDSLSPDDLFAIFYTSGTTGKPKGACVSNFTVINNVRFCQLRFRHGRSKSWKATVVSTLPMFHIFAGVLNNLSPIVNNSKIVYTSYKYDVGAIVESIVKYKANLTTLTPTILIDMLAYIEAKKITDVPIKIIQSGGAALSPEMVSRTFKVIPGVEEVRTGYGSSENGAVASMQSILEPNELKPFTVGQPLDFTEIRVVKPTTEEVVPHMEKGEIQTRGYNTMDKYLDLPDKTAEVISINRWYKTGDIGFMHPHGSIQISGRLKNMIIKGGENIYPEEVEQLIHKLEYVEDAHVVGVPDKRFGEQVCVWVKLKQGYSEAKEPQPPGSKQIHKDDIINFCKDNITYFKVPKYLIFVREFPMTPTKKVQKHLMTETSIKLLNLEDQV